MGQRSPNYPLAIDSFIWSKTCSSSNEVAVDRGSLSARCTSSSRGRCLRWPRESTPSEVVPSRGGGQARRTAPWGAAAWSRCPLGSAPSSAPAPPEGAPGGSGQLGTPRKRPAHWAPNHCLRGRRSHCASKHSGASHRGEAPRLTLTADPNPTPTLTLTLTRCQLQGGGSKEGCSFYAVYDGHGGARAASFCTEVSSTKAHSLLVRRAVGSMHLAPSRAHLAAALPLCTYCPRA